LGTNFEPLNALYFRTEGVYIMHLSAYSYIQNARTPINASAATNRLYQPINHARTAQHSAPSREQTASTTLSHPLPPTFISAYPLHLSPNRSSPLHCRWSSEVSLDAGAMASGRARDTGGDIPCEELRCQAMACSACIAAAALEPPGQRPPRELHRQA
jgi:hypothetical protein